MTTTAPHSTGRRCAAALIGVAVAAIATTAGTGTASAAPALTVIQTPARAMMLVGEPSIPRWEAVVSATPTATSGTVTIEVAATYCLWHVPSPSVRVGYRNLATGATGTVAVNPCPANPSASPAVATAHTGRGQIVFTTAIDPSDFSQLRLPGAGTFAAP